VHRIRLLLLLAVWIVLVVAAILVAAILVLVPDLLPPLYHFALRARRNRHTPHDDVDPKCCSRLCVCVGDSMVSYSVMPIRWLIPLGGQTKHIILPLRWPPDHMFPLPHDTRGVSRKAYGQARLVACFLCVGCGGVGARCDAVRHNVRYTCRVNRPYQPKGLFRGIWVPRSRSACPGSRIRHGSTVCSAVRRTAGPFRVAGVPVPLCPKVDLEESQGLHKSPWVCTGGWITRQGRVWKACTVDLMSNMLRVVRPTKAQTNARTMIAQACKCPRNSWPQRQLVLWNLNTCSHPL
jgi:hypothetical protein